MAYFLLLTVHLLCAFAFVGTVFFEVLMLPAVRRRVPARAMARLELAIGARARQRMPWVLLALYVAGLGLAWHHRGALSSPWASTFATLLMIKMALAASVFVHFLAAMWLHRHGRLHGAASRRLHRSVFTHAVAIIVLAKAMFHLP